MNTSSAGFDQASDRLKQLLEDANINVVSCMADLQKAPIAIVHTQDEEAWESLLKNSPKGSIRLRSSGGGILQPRHRVGENGVYEFYLQIQHDNPHFTCRDILLIFTELKKRGMAKAVAEGNCPCPLSKYFVKQATHNLSVLLILCQGFIAVHANARGEPEDVPRADWTDVKMALTKMRWPELCSSGTGRELLVEELLDKSANGSIRRANLRKMACDPQFWTPLLEGMRSLGSNCDKVIHTICREEWDTLTGNEDWGPVRELLRFAWDSAGANPGPGNVARAFVPLANRLGGA